MNIFGIDHLELYVGDAQISAHYYCSAFGFEVAGQGGPETGLASQRSVLVSQGGARLLLTSGLYPEHPANEYLQRHGDGVAVVALRVDDVAATFAELVERGAAPIAPPMTYADTEGTVVTAEVAGFGDVVHRLVQRLDGDGPFLPGAIVPVRQHAEEVANPQLFHDIDHLAVCVPDQHLTETAEFYKQVFGFAQIFDEYIDVAGQGMNSVVVQSPSGQVTLTLIEPDTTRRRGQNDEFLDSHVGAGVQHIALITDDIVATVDALGERGVRFLHSPSAYYDTIEDRVGALNATVEDLRRTGILVDRDHWGQLLQIFTESTHVRRTLFIEVVERRGARTFGSGNIKALYEAKEREMVVAPVPVAVDPEVQPSGA